MKAPAYRDPRPVTQPWVHHLTLMQQTVLLTAIRGPDGIAKYHDVKFLIRWLRRCVLLSALDGAVLSTPYEPGGGSFTGPSFDAGSAAFLPSFYWPERMEQVLAAYLRSVDELPHHFQMHFLHAAEILGYKHPQGEIRKWWFEVYQRLVHDLHLTIETEAQLDYRLADNREQWLASNDPATVE